MKLLKLLLVLLSVLLISGCGGNSTAPNNKAQGQSVYTVTDSRNKTLTFKTKPTRIVSCNVFVDEIVLDLVEHSRIAGLSRWVHDPGLALATKQAEDVKTIVEPNLESIIKVKPDVVLMPTTAKREFIMSLEDVGLKVYVYKPASRLKEIPGNVKAIGKVLGEEKKAEAIVADMEQRLAAIKSKTDKLPLEKKPSLLLILRFGAIGGEGCIYNDIITAAGIRDAYDRARDKNTNVKGNSRILSREEIIKTNPDILLMGSWSPGGKYKTSQEQLEDIYGDPAYQTFPAVKNRRAYIIPQSYVNSLSHHATEGIEKLYNIVYGDK